MERGHIRVLALVCSVSSCCHSLSGTNGDSSVVVVDDFNIATAAVDVGRDEELDVQRVQQRQRYQS